MIHSMLMKRMQSVTCIKQSVSLRVCKGNLLFSHRLPEKAEIKIKLNLLFFSFVFCRSQL